METKANRSQRRVIVIDMTSLAANVKSAAQLCTTLRSTVKFFIWTILLWRSTFKRRLCEIEKNQINISLGGNSLLYEYIYVYVYIQL